MESVVVLAFIGGAAWIGAWGARRLFVAAGRRVEEGVREADESGTRVVADVDVLSSMEPVVDKETGEVIDEAWFEKERRREARAKRASKVRGLQLWDWIPTIDQMKRDQEYEEALALTLECINAMERYNAAMRLDGGAAGWYERAAIIYRKLKDYDGEIELIDRGLSYMPEHEGLAYRRGRVVVLRDRAKQ